MKRIASLLIILTSCQSNIPEKKTILEKTKSESVTTSLQTVCSEKDSVIPYTQDPAIIRTCSYGKYKTVVVGFPDYKGRYSYKYKLYKNDKPISNRKMFTERQTELVEKVKKQITAEFESLRKDPENEGCFAGIEKIEFGIDELGIELKNDQSIFNYDFGFNGACFSVSGISIVMKLTEVEKYLAE